MVYPIFIRANQAKEVFGISEATIWNWSKAGYIKAHKVSDLITVFSVEEVKNYILNKGRENDRIKHRVKAK